MLWLLFISHILTIVVGGILFWRQRVVNIELREELKEKEAQIEELKAADAAHGARLDAVEWLEVSAVADVVSELEAAASTPAPAIKAVPQPVAPEVTKEVPGSIHQLPVGNPPTPVHRVNPFAFSTGPEDVTNYGDIPFRGEEEEILLEEVVEDRPEPQPSTNGAAAAEVFSTLLREATGSMSARSPLQRSSSKPGKSS